MASQEGINQDQTVDPGIDQRLGTQTIGDTLAKLEGCSKVLDLVRKNGLEYMLQVSGLRTFFAPTDQAFGESLPSNTEQFVNDHLVQGGFETFDLRRVKELKTESGRTVPVDARSGQPHIGSATIVRSDVVCTNGVIQVIDHLL
jgi:uncharacterized surface protein with fasciclin (FAS1) repeats